MRGGAVTPDGGGAASRARGAWGEEQVARWYRRAGYDVVDRNWRCPLGELDVVAVRGPVVVFCEVKARATDAFGSPASAVGPAKQRRLRRLAATWLAEHRVHGVEVRFDVATVVGVRVQVLESAF
jgi:putative endonuclease